MAAEPITTFDANPSSTKIIQLSIVDIAPVHAGTTATEAYENTIDLARAAERFGYSRFWVAEHHGLADTVASTTPEVLIARLAAGTSEIRVGSGTVLLNHYEPFKVAETFAGELGLPYAFGAFIKPTAAKEAFETYRERFEASEFEQGLDDPHGALAVNAACAETDYEAARLRASAEASYQRIRRGVRGPLLPVEEAVDELGGVPDPTPESLAPEDWPRAVSGSPATLATLLEEMTDAVGADEVVVQNLIEDPEDRIRSQELLADAVGLSSR